MNKTWLKCAFIRALKTVCQTAVALIGTTVVLSEVDWTMIASASVLAGIVSMLTSIIRYLPPPQSRQYRGIQQSC